jgi:hypothetical protein
VSKVGGRFVRATLVVASSFAFTACGSHEAATTQDAAVLPGDARVADLVLGEDAPSCPALPCLAHANAVIAACAPSGACTEQLTVTQGTTTMTKCFANGVKISITGVRTPSGGIDMVMALQKDAAACYSFITNEQSAQVGSAVYRDGAGIDLVSESASGPTLSVACPGEPAIVPDSSCDAALYALGGLYPFTNATCTSGTCTF